MPEMLLEFPKGLFKLSEQDLEELHPDFVDTKAPAGYEDTEKGKLMAEAEYPSLVIKAQAIVAVDTGEGRRKLVCFCPISDVAEVFERELQIIKLNIIDGNGEFTRDVPMFLAGAYHDRNIDVLTLDLEDLE